MHACVRARARTHTHTWTTLFKHVTCPWSENCSAGYKVLFTSSTNTGPHIDTTGFIYTYLYLFYCVFTHMVLVSILGVAEDNDTNIKQKSFHCEELMEDRDDTICKWKQL